LQLRNWESEITNVSEATDLWSFVPMHHPMGFFYSISLSSSLAIVE
jgi:hypothetical protein